MTSVLSCIGAGRWRTEVPGDAGLPYLPVLVVLVPHGPHGRRALQPHEALLARRHAQERVAVLLLGEQRRGRPGGAHELPATPCTQLDIVHGRPDGNRLERKRVAGEDARLFPG